MQREMTLKDFFLLIKKRILLISVTAAVLVAITALATFYIFKPVYEASEYILVGNLQNKNQENSYEETQKIPRMLASSVDFIKSPIVLNAVKEELGLKGQTFDGKLVIKNNKDSQLIIITVKDQDEELARSIANTTAVIAIDKMNGLLQFDQVKLLGKNDDVIKTNNELAALAIALIIGVLAGIGLAVIREQLDSSFKREGIVEELLGIPLLGNFSVKLELRKNGRGAYLTNDPDYERRSFVVKEKKKQVDKATEVS
ncbi:YveK family protein [Sporosarcina gallistercoris]|uniref:Polysaccharide chain length determinant N-terminal domain-containing protein n=1 Tax=Sporosarcina gallistercoris TaxID=2762245 RepID=A0ABR8PL06_9BACL|nr:Wzz/FepE/Etk N-terminal domain-containing protein [Sporosarcina gallistercoris]MBD7908754.1 hypothetical protein [Sporosarcina gallistercoris]